MMDLKNTKTTILLQTVDMKTQMRNNMSDNQNEKLQMLVSFKSFSKIPQNLKQPLKMIQSKQPLTRQQLKILEQLQIKFKMR